MIDKAIHISLNGEWVEIPVGGSVAALLQHLKISPDRVAVELNKALVRRRDWDTTEVDNGASVEVVEFVGGG